MALNELNSSLLSSQNVTRSAIGNPVFSQAFWIFLCVVAGGAAWAMGASGSLAFWTVAIAILPALTGIVSISAFSERMAGACLVFAWTALAVLATAYTGGALSPLSIYFALGPLTALSNGRQRLAVEAAVFGAIGFLGAVLIASLGWTEGVRAAFGPLAGFGALIAVVQIGVLAGFYGARQNRVSTAAVAPEEPSTLLSDAPAVVLDVSREGRIRQTVGDTANILGVRPYELVGRSLETIAQPDDRSLLTQAMADETSMRFSPIWNHGRRIEARGSSLRNGQRIVLVDVADIESRENELQETSEKAAEEARTVSTYFASLGHELRTPLNAVLGFADMLKSEVFGEIGPRNKEQAEMIHEGGQRLQLLVDDLLDAAKNRAGRLEVFPEDLDLRQTAIDAIRLMHPQAKREQVEVRLLDGNPVWGHADHRAVSQIWLNLISNAIKFSPAHSAISLRVEQLSDCARLSVEDEGEGLTPEEVARIGEAFTQAENARGKVGTGLGLSTVRTFAELHGGTFFIESEKGKGTTVYVTLPLGEAGEDVPLETGA